jgi:hypothetical protein
MEIARARRFEDHGHTFWRTIAGSGNQGTLRCTSVRDGIALDSAIAATVGITRRSIVARRLDWRLCGLVGSLGAPVARCRPG